MANKIWKEVFLIMCSSSRKNARNTERFSLSLRITDDYALQTLCCSPHKIVKENGNHVMYRVTPIFEGDNLLTNGVLMEGYSVEDKGAGVSYCVFAYNVQPGIEIDYATGESKLADSAQQEEQKTATVTSTPSPEPEKQEPATGSEASQADYILNTNTKKFHYPTCSSVNDMKEKNKQEFFGTRDEAISNGYSPCGRCKP